ncbi:hypothetical protein TSOC_001317, partial [Tetrabaena socialis]
MMSVVGAVAVGARWAHANKAVDTFINIYTPLRCPSMRRPCVFGPQGRKPRRAAPPCGADWPALAAERSIAMTMAAERSKAMTMATMRQRWALGAAWHKRRGGLSGRRSVASPVPYLGLEAALLQRINLGRSLAGHEAPLAKLTIPVLK